MFQRVKELLQSPLRVGEATGIWSRIEWSDTMRRPLLTVALVVLLVLPGCSVLPLDSGSRYEVSVETVAVDGSRVRAVAVTPLDNGTLPKGAEVSVDAGDATFTELSTMNYRETAYLTYVPSRNAFDLTERVREDDRGIDAANVTIDAVRISARGRTETHDLRVTTGTASGR